MGGEALALNSSLTWRGTYKDLLLFSFGSLSLWERVGVRAIGSLPLTLRVFRTSAALSVDYLIALSIGLPVPVVSFLSVTEFSQVRSRPSQYKCAGSNSYPQTLQCWATAR